jgi:hypothetical protein
MIFDTMLPGKVPSSIGVPEIQYMQHTSGSAFKLGAPLIYNAGEVEEGGADPTGIVGISLAPAGKAPGYEASNNPVVSTGRQRKVAVAKANRLTHFIAGVVNGSAVRIVPLITYMNGQYGITKYGNNWFVDISKTVAVRVEVIGFDDMWGTLGGVTFKWLEAHIAAP